MDGPIHPDSITEDDPRHDGDSTNRAVFEAAGEWYDGDSVSTLRRTMGWRDWQRGNGEYCNRVEFGALIFRKLKASSTASAS